MILRNESKYACLKWEKAVDDLTIHRNMCDKCTYGRICAERRNLLTNEENLRQELIKLLKA